MATEQIAVRLSEELLSVLDDLVVGPDDRMPAEFAASFDNLRVVPKSHLVRRVCTLAPGRLVEARQAIRAAVDC